MAEEIVFPRRPFRDVHQLVFLFQSWQLVLQEAELPPALQPLKEIPKDLEPVIARALRGARDQLEAAQARSEIALRFPATREFAALMQWGSVQLREVEGLIEGSDLEPAWTTALGLARELIDAAVEQIEASERRN